MKIFSLYDKVAKRFVSTTLAESEQMFVRSTLFAILMDYPINDVEFYCVGEFDSDLGIIKPCQPRLCSWDCYKFPETRMSKEKFLDMETIIKAAKEKKHQFLKETKDNQIESMNKMIENATNAIELENKKDKPSSKRIKELQKYISDVKKDLSKIKEVSNG